MSGSLFWIFIWVLKQKIVFFLAQSDTFYPILSTFFLNLHVVTWRFEKNFRAILDKKAPLKLDCAQNLNFFQRNLAQSWTKWLQIVIFLISIAILGYYKLDCAQNLEKKSAQSSAILDKMTSNSNIFNFYQHFRIL